MNKHSVTHARFSEERSYPVPPDHVFAAWSDPEAKGRWFAGRDAQHSLDFRLNGRERVVSHQDEGPVVTFESIYHDIVPGRRIVYSSTLSNNDHVATVSITTVEFFPDGAGTRLELTEQDTYLDGHEQPAWREQGTRSWLDELLTDLNQGNN